MLLTCCTFFLTFCQRPKLTFELFLLARMIAFALNPSTFAPSPSTVRHQFFPWTALTCNAPPLEPPTPGPPLPPTKPAEPTKATILSDALFQHEGNNQKSLILLFLLLHMKVPRRDDNHLSFDHESSHLYTCRSYGSGCSYSLGSGYD